MENKSLQNSFLGHRLTWVILSLLLSFILWVYVTDTEGKERTSTFTVGVEYANAEALRDTRNLIVTDMNANTITIRMSGSYRTMSKLKDSNIKAVVDLSVITSAIKTTCAYDLQLPSGVDESEITILSTSPENITVTVQDLRKKTVDLRASFTGSIAADYAAEKPSFDPATVIIVGPQEELDLVDHALVSIERRDIDETLRYATTYTLMDAQGNPVDYKYIELQTETVQMTMLVEATKTVPLDVDIIAGGGALRENCKIVIEPESIRISGDAALLKELNRISLGTIDLSDFESVYEATLPITLNNEFNNLSGKTEAGVKIEIRGLETRTFNIRSIRATNVTEGYTADVFDETLAVKIRGSSAALDSIAPNNLWAVADMTEYADATGIQSVPVSIYIDGDATAGVVGEYKVYVILSETGAEE